MIPTLRDPRMYPDILVTVQVTGDMITGDGVFAGTDLMDLPEDGFVLVNAIGVNSGDTIEVPQLNHHPTYTNHVPILQSGKAAEVSDQVWYKIRAKQGSKPVVMANLTGANMFVTGAFYRGKNNPIGLQAPDIVVQKHISASTANALEDTDLEDPGYPGWIYTWLSSNQVDTQVAIRQHNYKTGHYSLAPVYVSGTACQISKIPPWKEYVRQGGEPSVTITEVTAMAAFLTSIFYVDSRIPENQLWR